MLSFHLVPIEPASQPIKVPVNYGKAGALHAGNSSITTRRAPAAGEQGVKTK